MNKDMTSSVIAVNKHLKDTVDNMETFELLANMHPIDREYYNKISFTEPPNETNK